MSGRESARSWDVEVVFPTLDGCWSDSPFVVSHDLRCQVGQGRVNASDSSDCSSGGYSRLCVVSQFK